MTLPHELNSYTMLLHLCSLTPLNRMKMNVKLFLFTASLAHHTSVLPLDSYNG